jgi:hypothetical protein
MLVRIGLIGGNLQSAYTFIMLKEGRTVLVHYPFPRRWMASENHPSGER